MVNRGRRPGWQAPLGAFRWGVAGFLGAAAALMGGCGQAEHDPSQLRQAATIGWQQNWDEARPLIKQYLLEHPDDAVGHYYYGLSYLHNTYPQLTIAEGELLLAQSLLDPDKSHTKEAADMDYFVFKGRLHQKLAMVYLRAIRESLQRNIPYEMTRNLMQKAAEQTDLGLESDPDSDTLKQYRDFLKESLRTTPERVPEIVTGAEGSGGLI